MVAPSAVWRTVAWVGVPALTALCGWLIELAATWLLQLSWSPLPGRYQAMVQAVGGAPVGTIGSIVLGTVIGLTIVAHDEAEQARIGVRDSSVELQRGDTTLGVDRAAVSAVFCDGKDLVAQGLAGEELLREPCDLDRDRLEAAFRTHGYPWVDADPHGTQRRR